VEETLQRMPDREPAGIEEILTIDGEARRVALDVIRTQTVLVPADLPAGIQRI
jgi:hypothetical protein